ncbi:hypothetical protein AVEN_35034-1 [Araneus ventricosus]|uniref:Uncharacterized protein n=1 Tax=Araneus ventricosus TaxID=182803 RepID=A0A4Y2I0C6_ARAVE|nr:hypothetical protein AVEN_35034-1 [Araneus ventricosus]
MNRLPFVLDTSSSVAQRNLLESPALMNQLLVYTVIAVLLCNISVEARRKESKSGSGLWGKRSPNFDKRSLGAVISGAYVTGSPDVDKRSLAAVIKAKYSDKIQRSMVAQFAEPTSTEAILKEKNINEWRVRTEIPGWKSTYNLFLEVDMEVGLTFPITRSSNGISCAENQESLQKISA